LNLHLLALELVQLLVVAVAVDLHWSL